MDKVRVKLRGSCMKFFKNDLPVIVLRQQTAKQKIEPFHFLLRQHKREMKLFSEQEGREVLMEVVGFVRK